MFNQSVVPGVRNYLEDGGIDGRITQKLHFKKYALKK
jgi:hypothetical protein